MSSITYAWLLSLIAGLGTSVGGIIVILSGELKEEWLDFSMGFASGVMLTVAFLSLIDKALDMNAGYLTVVAGFVIGSLSIMVLDVRIPHIFSFKEYEPGKGQLLRTGKRKIKIGQDREKAGNNSNVILTGFLNGEPLRQLYSHAGLFVLPSYYEGLPIVLLEAMSYGLSCIASDIPANQEVG